LHSWHFAKGVNKMLVLDNGCLPGKVSENGVANDERAVAPGASVVEKIPLAQQFFVVHSRPKRVLAMAMCQWFRRISAHHAIVGQWLASVFKPSRCVTVGRKYALHFEDRNQAPMRQFVFAVGVFDGEIRNEVTDNESRCESVRTT
jgi:hypothetical protein